jgi:hypothetical protein
VSRFSVSTVLSLDPSVAAGGGGLAAGRATDVAGGAGVPLGTAAVMEDGARETGS